MAVEPTADERDRPRYGEGREALLRAAIRVVSEAGLRKLTYRAVAQEAGVTHGLVVHHFGTRDALVAEALQYSLDLSLDNSHLGSGMRSFSDLADGLATLVADDPDLQAFQYELILESRRRPELRPVVEQLYAGYRAAAAEALGSLGITDETLVRMVFATLDGLVFQQLALGDADATRRCVSTLKDLLAGLSSSAD